MTPICSANIEVLRQLKELIEYSRAQYARKQAADVAAVGDHVRHVLDHYRAFKSGITDNLINYNLRTRSSVEETQPDSAINNLNALILWLEQTSFPNDDIEIISEINLQQAQSERFKSTIEREMLYLINHSIHHMAYAALLAKSLGLDIPHHIGLAPGTATFERQQKEEEQHA